MRGIHRLFILFTLWGLGAGYLYGNGLTFRMLVDSVPLLQMVVIILVAVYTGYIHVFLHEFGHYLFGKMTGYKLVYFQMPNFRYDVKTKQFKRLGARVPGMMGQCLMEPPSKGDYSDKPYFLYLAGGLIVNVMTAILFYLGAFFLPGVLGFMFFALSLPPFILFVTNVIPYGFTDGSIIREISGAPLAKKLYFKQLELSALFEGGNTFSQIPEQYFTEVADGSFAASKLGEYTLLIAYQRALFELDFEKADRLLAAYQKRWNYLASPYAQVVANELLFCHAIFGRKEEAEALMARINQQPVLKAYYERSRRIQVAYVFFVQIDLDRAKDLLRRKPGTMDPALNEAELALQETLHNWLGSFMGLETQ